MKDNTRDTRKKKRGADRGLRLLLKIIGLLLGIVALFYLGLLITAWI